MTNFFVILLIFCAQILAVIFTPKQQSSMKQTALITSINLTSLTIFCLSRIFTGEIHLPSITTALLLTPLLGLFPFQSWYLRFFEKAAFGVILSFASLQGVILLSATSLLQPAQIAARQWFLAFLAGAIFTSSMLAILQKETRRLLAYLISSQLGFLLFANATNSTATDSGSSLMTLSFLGSFVGFMALISALEMRRGDLALHAPSGCYESYPKLASWLLVFGLIASGLPLSIGYVAEDLIFERTFHIEPMIDLACLVAISINSIAIVKIFLFLCQGTAAKERGIDLKKSEIAAIAFLFLTLLSATFLLI